MRFPFFITDLAFLALAAVSVILAFIYPNINSYAFSIIAAGLSVAMVKQSHDALSDFEDSLSRIEGLVWKPEFLSAGSLVMEYRGGRFTYSSSSGHERNGVIPVDYALSAIVKPGRSLEVRGTDEAGRPSVSGDRALYRKIEKEVLSFDRRYGLSMLRIGGGLMAVSVRLGFSREEIPRDRKLADMTEFTREFLDFASAVKKNLH